MGKRSTGSFVTLFMLIVALGALLGILLMNGPEFLHPQATAIEVAQWRVTQDHAQIQLEDERASALLRRQTSATRDAILLDLLQRSGPVFVVAIASALVLIAAGTAWRIAAGIPFGSYPSYRPSSPTPSGRRNLPPK